jgi:hypothetical protein
MMAYRKDGERHPLDVGAGAVARCFKIEDECEGAGTGDFGRDEDR